ncbi:hypothetical protein Tco_0907905 [Tanacetum coccineum]|uniref:Uncharacterized protein n=1 Tax=Tanacetum coccineum TaxID=301880 RepID=A0ABQ5CKL1_9ASTR
MAEEIKKLVKGTENVEEHEVDSSTLRQDDNQNDPGTRLKPRSNKESPKELTVNDPPPSSSTPSSSSSKLSATNRLLSLTRFMPRMKFSKLAQHLQEIMEEALPKMVDDRSQAIVAKMIADAIQQERENLRAEISMQINNAITNHIPSQVDSSVTNYMSGHILHDDLPIWLALKYKFEKLHVSNTPCRPSAVRPRDQNEPHDDAHLEGENSAKRQKKSEHGTFMIGESSSDSYATDDDELPNEEVSEELVDKIEEHQYYIDQMQNFLKNDIVWESRKEILVSPHSQKPTLVVQSCQRDPKAPALSLVSQDLLYLKKGNSRPEKIVMSLYKFPAVIFPDDDIEEWTSRWVDKSMKKFNPYARYSVEYWKNPHAKIFYINRQREPGNPKEAIHSNSKIFQINLNKNDIEDMYLLIVNDKVDDYVETRLLWSLSVFIKSTVIWERVHDLQLGVESYQQKVNLTAPIINFPGIEKYKMFSIVSEPVYGIIYKNSKKEKRVTRHQEIHKFYDATLKRVLEGLKSYNNNVNYGYMTLSLSKEDAKYLQLFEEEIEERLKHRDHMIRWKMYVNGRPLGSRREHPE